MDDLSRLEVGGVGAVDQFSSYKINGLTLYSLHCTMNDGCNHGTSTDLPLESQFRDDLGAVRVSIQCLTLPGVSNYSSR